MTAPGQQEAGYRPLFNVLTGTWLSQAGYVVAELGVADHLSADQPRTIEEIAPLVQADPDALYRVLRALAAAGVFTETSPRHFTLNESGAAMRTGAPFSHFLSINGREHIKLFAELLHNVRTGRPAAEKVYGKHFFDHLVEQPDAHHSFLASHGPSAHQTAAALIAESDLSGARTIVDVGGGDGGLLQSVLENNPHLHGILFDLPETIPMARKRLDQAGLTDRTELIGGSFFDTIPTGGDIYVIAHCLHNWNDHKATDILHNIRKALPNNGRLIVLERFISADTGFHPAKVMDLLMLTIDGRERTEAEYRDLLAKAGLKLWLARSLARPGLPTDNAFEAVVESVD